MTHFTSYKNKKK